MPKVTIGAVFGTIFNLLHEYRRFFLPNFGIAPLICAIMFGDCFKEWIIDLWASPFTLCELCASLFRSVICIRLFKMYQHCENGFGNWKCFNSNYYRYLKYTYEKRRRRSPVYNYHHVFWGWACLDEDFHVACYSITLTQVTFLHDEIVPPIRHVLRTDHFTRQGWKIIIAESSWLNTSECFADVQSLLTAKYSTTHGNR